MDSHNCNPGGIKQLIHNHHNLNTLQLCSSKFSTYSSRFYYREDLVLMPFENNNSGFYTALTQQCSVLGSRLLLMIAW